MKKIIIGILSVLLIPGWALAIPITVQFTASGFTDTGSSPPVETVTGTIVYEADNTTANIVSLTSINLTIGSHTYLLSEVGFATSIGTAPDMFQIIYGNLNGTALSAGYDDFLLQWNQEALIPYGFAYTTSSTLYGQWRTTGFTDFTVTASPVGPEPVPAPVPEPTTMLLLGMGLLGLVGFSRHKRSS